MPTFQNRPIKRDAPSDDAVLADADRINAEWREQSADDFSTFVRGLVIKTADGPRCFENVIAVFQREAFDDVRDAVHAIRDGTRPVRRRFWWERTKKAGKDSDLACIVLWLMAFPRRPFQGQIGAADGEQAAIVKDRVSDLLYHNPWLNELVEITGSKIRSRKRREDGTPLARIDILNADVAGSPGPTPDILIINELTAVKKWKFVENLMDNADGVPNGIVIIATNAGIKGSPAEVWRENAIRGEDWTIGLRRQPAPWADKVLVKAAKIRGPAAQYKRLWWGIWMSGLGDAVSETAIALCFNNDLRQLAQPEEGWFYIGAYDLGVSHDHSGVTILGINENEQRIRVARFRGYEPDTLTGEGQKKQVNLTMVENDICRWCRVFNISWFGYDPAAGGSYMAQRLRKRGVPTVEMSFGSPKKRTDMAEAFVSAVESGILECYDDADGRLRRDFGKFDIMRTTHSVRLEAVSDTHGHADIGTALIICLPRARDLLGGFGALQPDEVLADPADDRELTVDELADLPPELREIYESEDGVGVDHYEDVDFSDVF